MQELLDQLYGYLHSMWRYRWSGLFIAWTVAIAGWMAVYAMPDQYESKAAIYVDTDSIMKPLLKGLAVETDEGDEIAVMAKMLLTRDNLLSVIRETDMDLNVDTPAELEGLVERLRKSISLSGGGGRKGSRASIYEIKYNSTSADQVYQVVSILLNRLIESSLTSTRTDTEEAQKFLDERIADYEQRLIMAEQRLAEFKKKNVGLMPNERGGYYTRLQGNLDAIQETRSALLLAERRKAELDRQLHGETPVLDSSTYSESTALKLRQYQELLADMLTQYTEQHPDVVALKAKIDELAANKPAVSDGVAAAGGGDTVEFNPVYQQLKVELSRAKVEVEGLRLQLAEQESKVETLKESIDAIPQVEAELSKLNRDYEVTKARYLDLVERREAARLSQDAERSGSNITYRVIDPPIVPVLPSGPNRMLLLSGALGAALGAGMAWTFLMSLLNPTFISFRQVTEAVSLPVLGAVSLYVTRQHARRRKLQLGSFIVGVFCLVGAFGVVLMFKSTGSAYVRALLSQSGI